MAMDLQKGLLVDEGDSADPNEVRPAQTPNWVGHLSCVRPAKCPPRPQSSLLTRKRGDTISIVSEHCIITYP